MNRAALAAVSILLLAPGPASADADPIVEAVSEANLAPVGRSGLVAAASFGTGVQIGAGVRNATGFGGVASLRLGQVASPRWIVGLEIDLTLYREAPDADAMVRVNQSALVGVGGQVYARPGLWGRIAVGGAAFTRRVEGASRDDEALGGLAAAAGAGVALVQRGRLTLQLETLLLGALVRGGLVVGGGLALGLAVD